MLAFPYRDKLQEKGEVCAPGVGLGQDFWSRSEAGHHGGEHGVERTTSFVLAWKQRGRRGLESGTPMKGIPPVT